jgi:hypothetical protein
MKSDVMANELEKDCRFYSKTTKRYRDIRLYLGELIMLKEKIKCDYSA